jgi:hypothetical protein
MLRIRGEIGCSAVLRNRQIRQAPHLARLKGIYSLDPLEGRLNGRRTRTRTRDRRIWNPVLYQLSYTPALSVGGNVYFKLPVMTRIFLLALASFLVYTL